MSDSRYSASQVLTAALVTTLVALAPLTSQAQSNAPLTGGMTSSPPAAAPAQALPQAQLPTRPVVQQVQTPMPQPQPATASTQVVQPASAAPAEEAFGDVTRGLLAAQADGRRAGNMLPVLGPVSTAAWNRYLESFSHPIPEYLQKRVETKNTN
ncbi:DUF3613 domain-containing protein [Achromobacter spanius]|jgi:hypothetical protein|uniref:DUF3613 domain-containing protein n=1 Tax=Achromobacter spanius TaxID=217203 RepID=UPI003F68C197